MGKARVRALTHFVLSLLNIIIFSRNGESPSKGIDTLQSLSPIRLAMHVEMGEARVRALTPEGDRMRCGVKHRRNGESPSKGIDTLCKLLLRSLLNKVEMGKARVRALTPLQSDILQCNVS